MKIHLVNFATTERDVGFGNYRVMRDRQNESAQKFGIDSIYAWERQDLLKTEFYRQHRVILDQPRIGGYGLWKPFVIYDTLHKVADGDVVFYIDADIRFVENPQPLIDLCCDNNGFFLVELRRADRYNALWTKRDCFHFMGMDTPKYHYAYHFPSGMQIYRKNKATLAFMSEVLRYSCNANIITDAPNICGKPNLDEFIDHRHDQSVLSLMATHYGLQGFRWASQWGNHEKLPEYRVEGEYLAEPYSGQPYTNSPYGTILSDQLLEGHQDPLPVAPNWWQRLLKR